MIQRIQHLYLFINCLIAGYFVSMPIIEITTQFNGVSQIDTISATSHIKKLDGGASIEMSTYTLPIILIAISGFLSFVAIFQFKNRKLQRGNCFLNYFLIIVFILSIIRLWMGVEDVDVLSISLISWVNVFLMIMMLILNFSAVKGINRDEELVRSVDRLR